MFRNGHRLSFLSDCLLLPFRDARSLVAGAEVVLSWTLEHKAGRGGLKEHQPCVDYPVHEYSLAMITLGTSGGCPCFDVS